MVFVSPRYGVCTWANVLPERQDGRHANTSRESRNEGESAFSVGRNDLTQLLIGAQPEHKIHLIALAPAHQFVPAVTGIAAQHDLHFRPPGCRRPRRDLLPAGGRTARVRHRKHREADSSNYRGSRGKTSLPVCHAAAGRWCPHPERSRRERSGAIRGTLPPGVRLWPFRNRIFS